MQNDEIAKVYEVIDNAIKQNDKSLNVTTLLSSVEEAANKGITAAKASQGIKSVEGLGTVNVITIKLDKANQEAIIKAYYNALAATKYPEEMAKVDSYSTAEEIREDLKKDAENFTADEDQEAILEVYTAMFGNEFKGLKLTQTTDKDSCSFGKDQYVSITRKDKNGRMWMLSSS